MSLCQSHCTHGGVCVLQAGHPSVHDSRYCQWATEDALPEDEANRIFLTKAQAQGHQELAEGLLLLQTLLRVIDADGEEVNDGEVR